MTLASLTFLFAFSSTLYMTGLIAFVQAVHYPLFLLVDPSQFPAYHREHTSRTTLVVLFPMLLELLSSGVMLVLPTPHAPLGLRAAAFAAVSITWLSTFLISVPIHGRLGTEGHDPAAIQSLVVTNWIRLIAWFGHSLILLVIAAIELG